jgi:hypothetical protein
VLRTVDSCPPFAWKDLVLSLAMLGVGWLTDYAVSRAAPPVGARQGIDRR